MRRIAALGEQARVQGFGLAGALVLAAEDPESVRAAWAGLDADIVVVVLTPAAAEVLGDTTAVDRLTVVMPP
jgi:vacuolar-type H+-ATPase subunit F/Vma7